MVEYFMFKGNFVGYNGWVIVIVIFFENFDMIFIVFRG